MILQYKTIEVQDIESFLFVVVFCIVVTMILSAICKFIDNRKRR